LDINFNKENTINSSYIINNAGSVSISNMPADRGIGEYDVGQYDSKCYVDYFCGVSVLLRRSLLIDRTIFVPEFFAYYEDSELSRYIREKGYKILYAPRSIVYHKHSSTSSEGSPLWQLLVKRSQKIYNYQNNFDKLYEEINQLEEDYKNQIPPELYVILKEFSSKLLEKLKNNNSVVEKLKPIGIYNSYWNTKGGGESHALSFATILQKYETVYLISEEDFSIEELSAYYKIDLTNCRKIVQNYINTEFTKKFHIFINSSFQSNLESKAEKSYYIVYFPQKKIDSKLLNSYEFLYMNDYTKDWGKKYWGDTHKNNVICPLAMLEEIKELDNNIKKEKIIISVGRFFVGGHSKKQDVIAKVFRNLFNSHPKILKEWKLVLIGSLDFTQKTHVDYVNEIKRELVNSNYEIIVNANKETLVDYYKKSFIYIHASGYGINENIQPENIEHFGITPIEAMQYGCYPIVYGIGGPKETLEKANIGLHFKTEEELANQLLNAINLFDDTEVSKNVFNLINKFIEINDPTKLIDNLYIENKEK
jgi:glycosyltransferase involved in cell wall biosynthesis